MLGNNVQVDECGVDEPIKSDVISSFPSSFLSRRGGSSEGLTAVDSAQLTDSTILFNEIISSTSRPLFSFGNEDFPCLDNTSAAISFSPLPLSTSPRCAQVEAMWPTTPLACAKKNLLSIHSPVQLQSSSANARKVDAVSSRSSGCQGKPIGEDLEDSNFSTPYCSLRHSLQTALVETESEEETDALLVPGADERVTSIASSSSLSEDLSSSFDELAPLPPEETVCALIKKYCYG